MTKQFFFLAFSLLLLNFGFSGQTQAHPNQYSGAPRRIYYPANHANRSIYQPIPVQHRQSYYQNGRHGPRQVIPVTCSRGCPPGYTLIGRQAQQGIAIGEPHPDDYNLCNCKLINRPGRR